MNDLEIANHKREGLQRLADATAAINEDVIQDSASRKKLVLLKQAFTGRTLVPKRRKVYKHITATITAT